MISRNDEKERTNKFLELGRPWTRFIISLSRARCGQCDFLALEAIKEGSLANGRLGGWMDEAKAKVAIPARLASGSNRASERAFILLANSMIVLHKHKSKSIARPASWLFNSPHRLCRGSVV